MYIFKRHANSLKMSKDEVGDILTYVTEFFLFGKSINTRHLDRSIIPKINDSGDQIFVHAAYASDATHLITLDKKSGILDLENTPFTCCTPTDFLNEINHDE